jgi:hypothetical protein
MEISLGTANKLRKDFGEKFKLHSTFTHLEGRSPYSSKWTEIETTWYYGPFLFRIVTEQDTKDSERKERYFLLFNEDYMEIQDDR